MSRYCNAKSKYCVHFQRSCHFAPEQVRFFLVSGTCLSWDFGTTYLSASAFRSACPVDGTLFFVGCGIAGFVCVCVQLHRTLLFFSPFLQYPSRHKHSCLIIHCACMTAYPPNLGPDHTRHHVHLTERRPVCLSLGLSSPIWRLTLPLRKLVKARNHGLAVSAPYPDVFACYTL